jgi:hypothetical protein
MPRRRRSLVTVIRKMVQEEMGNALGSLFGSEGEAKGRAPSSGPPSRTRQAARVKNPTHDVAADRSEGWGTPNSDLAACEEEEASWKTGVGPLATGVSMGTVPMADRTRRKTRRGKRLNGTTTTRRGRAARCAVTAGGL